MVDAQKLTPMMAQYFKIREQYADCILMFRMGDFYEMFFEDAVIASKILQIALTCRNKKNPNEKMCGVPFHAVDNYLSKLTRAGKKVALCDQVSKPDGNGIVKREVIRVVTPGTTFDDNLLDQKTNNYVSAIYKNEDKYAFAYADITTGDFCVTEIHSIKDLESEISRVLPSECIYDDGLIENDSKLRNLFERFSSIHLFPYSYLKDADSSLKNYFEIKSLSVFGMEGKELAVHLAGMLYEYLKDTQKSDLKHIQKINYYENSGYMPLDEACIRNLEIFYTNRNSTREGSLIWVLDQSATAMGGRLLRNWLIHPLLSREALEKRLDLVEIFVNDSRLLGNLRENLNKFYDVERLLSRISVGTGNARDLKAMQFSLEQVPAIKSAILGISAFDEINADLFTLDSIKELLEKSIEDEPPISVRDGGMIKKGYNQELDELKSISSEGKTFIKAMQEREIKRSGINSLKVKFNKVFGYYIEISKSNLSNVPDDYIRKQTLVNAERFITPELKEYEEKVLNAEEKLKELEYELFYGVRMEIVKEIVKLQKLAKAIAKLDVLSTFAFISKKNNYSKPQLSENNLIKFENGRHPVIENMSFSRDFVPNSCLIDDSQRFLLITGPNMGGKSTFLRQVALIVLMAQIGCFVPAENVELGLCDRIFTRVGASDNLIKGESTFMVEMQEASFILNNATEKSLVILDELGRGTSTYDGLSLAWAITEYIYNEIKAKTLFATHYHELTNLIERLPSAKNLSVAVKEKPDLAVIFLYKIVEGAVNKSYGIEVAKLAGLPMGVVSRARGVLDELEKKIIKAGQSNPDQMDLFNKTNRSHKPVHESDNKFSKMLKNMDIDNMTPIKALEKLSEMKNNFTSG